MNDLDTSPVLKAMQVFFMVNLPDTEVDLATYGEDQVKALCEHFKVDLERMGCQLEHVTSTEWPALKAHMFRNKTRSTDVMFKKLFTDQNLKIRL
ncbi:hypothetical protein DPMN_102335 [Dreissena polymorpha]|uniref:Uncharacterized protein n=1 Tax=Dreissena polymorpha TaxID=45954 RepID=A0A9D4LKW7_DREPO|nr:hypothetical protein DPMN_102335 [Dreissena polymorpha]